MAHGQSVQSDIKRRHDRRLRGVAQRDVRLEAIKAGRATKTADPVDVLPAGLVGKGRGFSARHFQVGKRHHEPLVQLGDLPARLEP